MKKTTKQYELLMVIVNQGFIDPVIAAAKKAGASGGTIISGRASAKKQAQKNYGLAIAGDKDVIMILVNKESKNKIMDAIYKVSGIETKGMAIIFTIPADNVVGLRKENKK